MSRLRTPLCLALCCLCALPALADSSAAQISDPADLLPGISAQGSVGDYLLANDFVRVVIDDIPNPHGFANTGGNIIDAATAAGEDRFSSLFTLFDSKFGRQANYDTLTIVDAGGGAATAHIRVSGVDSEDPLLAVVTDYRLAPNNTYVEVTTTLTNNGSDDLLQFEVGDAVQWGLTVHFLPGWDNDGRNVPGDGYDIGGIAIDSDWVAGNGQGSSYGYSTPGGNMEVLSGSTWSDPNVAFLDLNAGGGSAGYTRWFMIGDGSISDISDLSFALNSTPTGSLSGTITENGTGTPVQAASVVITTTQCVGTDGAVSYTVAETDASGNYSANLEPGNYKVQVKAFGRADSPCLDAAITTGNTTNLNTTMDQPATLNWTITDGVNPLPGKLSLLFSPVDARFSGPTLGDKVSLIGGNAILSPSGTGSTQIPAGDYEVWVSRGVEYDVHTETISLAPGGSANINAVLTRVIDSTGYLSTDLHVHAFNSADSGVEFSVRAEQSAAEGLEVCVPTDHDFHSDMASAITSSGLGAWVGTMPGNEITTVEWGHFNGFPMTVDNLQPRNGALVWEGLSPQQIFDGIRADAKDPVVQINHPRAGGIGYFDLTSVNPVTGDAGEDDYSTDFDAVEVFNGKRLSQVAQTKNDWYRMLSAGRTVTGIGNTDTHQVYSQEIGYPRNFVQVGTDDPSTVTENALRDAIKNGRSFFTNGPFVEMWVNSIAPADLVTDTDGTVDVRIRIQAPDWIAVNEADIVVNGQVVQTIMVPTPGTTTRLDQTYPINLSSDSWIAVEVRGGSCDVDDDNVCLDGQNCAGRLDPVVPPLFGTRPVCPYAHTNPVYVDQDGNAQFDAPGNPGLLVLPIADSRGVDATGTNTLLDEIVTVQGVVTAPSYLLDVRNNLVFFQDDSIDTVGKRSGGTATFQQGLIRPELEFGDLIRVTGTVTQFFGLTEIADLSIDVLEQGRPTPDPLVLTVNDLRNPANDEQWEGMLIRVNDLSIVGGTWPAFGESASIDVSDPSTASDITLRIDADTDIDGSAPPVGTFDVVAPLSQFKFSSPFLGFYQISPRQRIDIIEPGDPMRILHPAGAYPVTSCDAQIAWYTNQEGISRVSFGTVPQLLDTVVEDLTPVNAHHISLSGLLPATQYFYQVETDGVFGQIRPFTTAGSADPTVIDGPQAALIDPTTVQIRWQTDVPADSTVRYGFTDAYGLTAVNNAQNTYHAITLSGLSQGETYHYQIENTTPSCGGGAFSSSDLTFTVPACSPPCTLADGSVPEVSGRTAAVPLTVDKAGSGLEFRFEFQGDAREYHLYVADSETDIAAGDYDAKFCDLANNVDGSWTTDNVSFGSFTLSDGALLPEGNVIVVAEESSQEGSYGFDSIGNQRSSDLDGTTPNDSGCGGGTGPGCAPEIFFSEYIEGSSNNKALEIFNPTGATVDFSAALYQIEIYFNGSANTGNVITLGGTVDDLDVHVVCDNDSSAAILNVCDQTALGNFFNGDDTILLKKDGVVIDSIGQYQFDPGAEWGSGNASTQNNTLRRNADVLAGDTDETDVFDPAAEWTGFPQDTFDGLGSHTSTCPN